MECWTDEVTSSHNSQEPRTKRFIFRIRQSIRVLCSEPAYGVQILRISVSLSYFMVHAELSKDVPPPSSNA